jgi:hypothetical protein
MRYWIRSWIMAVTMTTVTASANIPSRMVQTRQRRSSMMARISAISTDISTVVNAEIGAD